jgi:serine/threonine protein kinase
MEYFENGDLQRYLNHPFPEPEAKEIVYQILEGLRFMHKNSFAHRDLKPAVRPCYCYKPDILDFAHHQF